jgi:hypothetical protein
MSRQWRGKRVKPILSVHNATDRMDALTYEFEVYSDSNDERHCR